MIFLPDGTYEIERTDNAIPCSNCSGYAERVQCTPLERQEYGCGRSYDCCSAAFVCIQCGNRMVTSLPAPETDFD